MVLSTLLEFLVVLAYKIKRVRWQSRYLRPSSKGREFLLLCSDKRNWISSCSAPPSLHLQAVLDRQIIVAPMPTLTPSPTTIPPGMAFPPSLSTGISGRRSV